MQPKDVLTDSKEMGAEYAAYWKSLEDAYEAYGRELLLIKDIEGVERQIHRDQLLEAVEIEVKRRDRPSTGQRRRKQAVAFKVVI